MPEPTLTSKQKEALDHPVRKAIYDFLKASEDPQGLGAIAGAIEVSDLAVVQYRLNPLIDVDLVEKVFGTIHYRVVDR